MKPEKNKSAQRPKKLKAFHLHTMDEIAAEVGLPVNSIPGETRSYAGDRITIAQLERQRPGFKASFEAERAQLISSEPAQPNPNGKELLDEMAMTLAWSNVKFATLRSKGYDLAKLSEIQKAIPNLTQLARFGMLNECLTLISHSIPDPEDGFNKLNAVQEFKASLPRSSGKKQKATRTIKQFANRVRTFKHALSTDEHVRSLVATSFYNAFGASAGKYVSLDTMLKLLVTRVATLEVTLRQIGNHLPKRGRSADSYLAADLGKPADDSPELRIGIPLAYVWAGHMAEIPRRKILATDDNRKYGYKGGVLRTYEDGDFGKLLNALLRPIISGKKVPDSVVRKSINAIRLFLDPDSLHLNS